MGWTKTEDELEVFLTSSLTDLRQTSGRIVVAMLRAVLLAMVLLFLEREAVASVILCFGK